MPAPKPDPQPIKWKPIAALLFVIALAALVSFIHPMPVGWLHRKGL
jgi:hypothetical protein